MGRYGVMAQPRVIKLLWTTAAGLAFAWTGPVLAQDQADTPVTEQRGKAAIVVTFALSDRIQLRLDALSLLNEPQYLERPVAGAMSDISYYGTRYQAGVRFRF